MVAPLSFLRPAKLENFAIFKKENRFNNNNFKKKSLAYLIILSIKYIKNIRHNSNIIYKKNPEKNSKKSKQNPKKSKHGPIFNILTLSLSAASQVAAVGVALLVYVKRL